MVLLCVSLLVCPARNLSANASNEGSALILSLDDALSRALEYNLDLKKNLIDLSTAEYSANRLWSEVFPTISGNVGAAFNSPVFSGDGFALNEDRRTLSAGLGLNLTLNAGIPYAMRNIRLAYQTRLLNYEDARTQLEIRVTKNFYSLIADRDNLDFLADMLNLAQLQHEKNQVAFNNGLTGERALMQSRLGLENARYNLSAARSVYANRMGEFLSMLGITGDVEPVLEGKIEISRIEADAQRLIREYLPRRPDIVSRRQEIERLENAQKQALMAGRAPSLRFSVDWNSRNFDPFADSLSGSATLNIPIDPWVPGSRASQSIRSAKLAVDKARLDLQSAEEAAASQIRSLAANLRNSWDSIEIARLSLGVAERGYELTEQGFRNGTVESLALEDARNNLANARQRLLQSELAYLSMFLDLSAALNKNWKELMNEYLPQE
ncbi:MAG: TolC family protein [Treponema sp.]|jgi:outer membrane protein TolC|nr:TolC family protein [Treponema sp.]